MTTTTTTTTTTLCLQACVWVEFHIPGGMDFTLNMVTKRFVLAARQIRVCVIFRPMGDAQTRAGAVLCKKAEPRHAVHPMRAGDGGADRAPKSDGKRIHEWVPSARARFCLGLRLTASRASEASRLAHHYKWSSISSREITSSRLLWVRLPWSVLWRLVFRKVRSSSRANTAR